MKQFKLRALPLALLCASLGVSTSAGAVPVQPPKPIFKACDTKRTTGKGTCRVIPMPANAVAGSRRCCR